MFSSIKKKIMNVSKYQTSLETPVQGDFIGLEKKRNNPIISYHSEYIYMYIDK